MRVRRYAAAIGLVAASLVCTAMPGSTAPGDPMVEFTAAGDYGAGPNSFAVFDTVDDLDPDAHFALGDLSYGTTGQEQAWCDAVTSRVGAGFPFELLAGNHESNGQNGNINDFSACLPNQLPGVVGTYGRQYYVDVPAAAPLVRYVMISPGLPYPEGTWSYALGTSRYQWTAAAIDGARTANIPWVVVGMHKPCISQGEYGCEAGADLMNLLVSKRVDLVLSGHEHLYERSKQLAHAPGCSAITPGTFTAACVADSDGDLVKGAGTVTATVGTGGVGLRDINADAEAGYFAASSGANQNPTFGVLDVSATADVLSASFQRASGGTFTDAFTITRPAVNTLPTAGFTESCTGLTCSFDGTTSTDVDGTIASYAWDFGDGTTGTGATPGHAYATAGPYTVGLTVTDNLGGTGSTSHPVTVTAPPGGTTIAADTFTRTVTNGFGTATTGGTWSTAGGPADFSVSAGSGRVRLAAPSAGRSAFLAGVSSTTTDMLATLWTDKPGTGGGLGLTAIGRRTSTDAQYRGTATILSTGGVRLLFTRKQASGVETQLSNLTVPGLSYAVGDRLLLRMRVSGTSPTLLQLKVWKLGTSEPAGWQLTASDSTAELQVTGSIGYRVYLSGSATNAPVIVSIDDLAVTNQ